MGPILRPNKTNNAISHLHSNSQNVNELIQKYSVLQLVELEHMVRYNLLRKRYSQDMIPFVKDVLLPRLRLEIQAKIIDVAVEGRKSEGGFKRSSNKSKKSRKSRKSKKSRSRKH